MRANQAIPSPSSPTLHEPPHQILVLHQDEVGELRNHSLTSAREELQNHYKRKDKLPGSRAVSIRAGEPIARAGCNRSLQGYLLQFPAPSLPFEHRWFPSDPAMLQM